jgi:hypothetical protein
LNHFARPDSDFAAAPQSSGREAQKTFITGVRGVCAITPLAQIEKVFWFFFSKKNRLPFKMQR